MKHGAHRHCRVANLPASAPFLSSPFPAGKFRASAYPTWEKLKPKSPFPHSFSEAHLLEESGWLQGIPVWLQAYSTSLSSSSGEQISPRLGCSPPPPGGLKGRRALQPQRGKGSRERVPGLATVRVRRHSRKREQQLPGKQWATCPGFSPPVHSSPLSDRLSQGDLHPHPSKPRLSAD